MTNASPKTIYLKDYQPADFAVESVHLNLELNEDVTVVTAVLKLFRHPKSQNQTAPLFLNGEAMELQSVAIDQKPLSASDYQVDKKSLTIPNVPNTFTLETVVQIKPQDNTELSGLYKSSTNFCTQCEAHGFRRITYFLDRPDVMTRFTTTITADKDKYPMLLSNGNLIETKNLDNNRHWVHWEDPSLKPAYLFALVAGDFDLIEDTFTTMSGKNVALKLYLEKGFRDQGDYAMQSLQRAMKWDEERYGREYDLDIYMIVAVSDFNMGAMENKGLNIFNTKYILAKPETATDSDYVAIEAVIGHEYFHNWSGNRITCRDWFQLTLKEGLTVFRDQHFTEDMTSQAVARLDTVNVVRSQQFTEDAGPMAHPIRPASYIEINNFYTLTVYRKGSEVIRMVQTLITPEKFREGMDLYFERHDGQAVTTDDFLQAMVDASGKDLTQFRRWYEQAGTPVLDVESVHNESAKTFTLTVKQSCPATPNQPKKEPFHLPLAVGLIGDHCSDMPLQLEGESPINASTVVLEITKPEQAFTFVNVECKPVPSLLRGFSAPVKLNYAYTDKELAWLLQCDSDPFARWEAGQWLAQNVIARVAQAVMDQQPLTVDPLLIDAFSHLLEKGHEDLSFLSRLLTLPSENYLLSTLKIDVSAIHVAREHVKSVLAKELESHWLALYEKHHDAGDYVFNIANMAQRDIKNTCLFYLNETGDEKYHTLALEQFTKANNMTDQMGALSALNNHAIPHREKALAAFYAQWKDEPLIVNKWLSLQANSTLPDTLDKVKDLLGHKAFDIHNPNNVYALLVGFAGNVSRFHDGEASYQFVTDQVLAIDKNNAQVAARLLQPLTAWGRMDAERQALMKAQLTRIAKTKGISNDIYEIATKSV